MLPPPRAGDSEGYGLRRTSSAVIGVGWGMRISGGEMTVNIKNFVHPY
jgi:hypothetical protein